MIKFSFLLAILAASIPAGTLQAQSRPGPSADCARFQRVIEGSEKELSAIYADGITDNSAPRATMREQRTTNELQLIRLNLDLMVQNRCPVSVLPITRFAYLLNAMQCETERLRNPSAQDIAACDRSRWARSQGDSATAASPRP